MYQTRGETIWESADESRTDSPTMPKPPPDPELARRVKGLIAYSPHSQERVAAELGIKADQLRRYLRAELSFEHEQLVVIAQMCNVALRLLYEEFPPYQPPGELGRALRDWPTTDEHPDPSENNPGADPPPSGA